MSENPSRDKIERILAMVECLTADLSADELLEVSKIVSRHTVDAQVERGDSRSQLRVLAGGRWEDDVSHVGMVLGQMLKDETQ